MAGPPENIPPSDLWAQITQVPRPHRLVDFPRRDPGSGEPMGKVALQVLTQEEQMTCAAAAEAFTRKIIKEAPRQDEAKRGYDDVYNNAAAVEVLFRACRRTEDVTRPFFPAPAEIRKHLTADEVGVLMTNYFTVQTELGPIVAHLSSEEVDAWITRLVEGGSAYPLDLLSSDVLRTLVVGMASQLRAYATATSSPGSEPDESTPSESRRSQPQDEDDSAGADAGAE